MINSNIKLLADYVKNELPEKATELVDSMDLVNLVFDDIYDSINVKISTLVKNRKLEEAKSVFAFCEHVQEIKEIIDECSSLFVNEELLENQIKNESLDESLEVKQVPDYAKYSIDRAIPHSLYEDFTYTRVCGFEFQNVKYEVNNMKSVLLSLCEILSKQDLNKMLSFIGDKSMQGRKCHYFSSHSVVEDGIAKNERIGNLDLYVWVNSSCNQIRNVIKRILKKFDIKFDELKIYLRADYSELHT